MVGEGGKENEQQLPALPLPRGMGALGFVFCILWRFCCAVSPLLRVWEVENHDLHRKCHFLIWTTTLSMLQRKQPLDWLKRRGWVSSLIPCSDGNLP